MAKARNWTDEEVGAIVESYFRMLNKEVKGAKYVKAVFNRELQGKIDRTRSSIEFKHQNVSAVLEVLGLPYIDGYRPLRNYQKALVDAVAAHLHGNPTLHHDLAGRNVAEDDGPSPAWSKLQPEIEYAPPPVLAPPPIKNPEARDAIRRMVRCMGNPAERDARNRRLGRAGEKYVLAAEKGRLTKLGLGDLAQAVRWVARLDGDGLGYDIRSFAGEGDRPDEQRWLEVKTTTGPERTPFFITRNELEVSCANEGRYRVVRLHGFHRQKGAFRLSPPLHKLVTLAPSVYRASFEAGR